jgi:hypothetical protein
MAVVTIGNGTTTTFIKTMERHCIAMEIDDYNVAFRYIIKESIVHCF